MASDRNILSGDDRKRLPITLGGPSRTKQEFVDECDVNFILANWKQTGHLNHVQASPGTYGDFSEVSDYQSALASVQDAEDSFLSLPAAVRSRMGNDPATLLNFMEDPANYEEAVELGLLNPPAKPETPTPVDPPKPAPIAGE